MAKGNLYDPYGNLLSMSGPLAEANLYRFSSKEWHPNSGLVYYLYRFYDASLQRWLNQDPINEPGFELLRGDDTYGDGDGPNLYVFVRNTPVNDYDAFGLRGGASRASCGFYDDLSKSPNACDRAYSPFGSFFCRAFGESPWEQCVRGCLLSHYSTGGEDCSNPCSSARFAKKIQNQHNYCYAVCALKVFLPRPPRLPPLPFPPRPRF